MISIGPPRRRHLSRGRPAPSLGFQMQRIGIFAIMAMFCWAAILPARSAQPPPTIFVSQSESLGYSTVAEALVDLRDRMKLIPLTGGRGVSFLGPDNKTTWTFTGKDEAAYPAVVRLVTVREGTTVSVDISILCEAAQVVCDQFRKETRENTVRSLSNLFSQK